MLESIRAFEWVALAVGLAVWASTVLAAAAILRKAGFSRWWSILAVVPVVNWIALIVFACSDWPALRGPSEGHA